jgi:hypothetical protein
MLFPRDGHGHSAVDSMMFGCTVYDHPPISAGSGVVSITGISTSISAVSGQPFVSATPMALVLQALQGQVRMHPSV